MEDVIPDVATDPLNNAASNVPRFLSPGRSLISAWNFAVAPSVCREIVILFDSVLESKLFAMNSDHRPAKSSARIREHFTDSHRLDGITGVSTNR